MARLPRICECDPLFCDRNGPIPVYPLRFEPIFRRYLWGGRRLLTELAKPVGDENCAESWEVVDRPEDNSVVAAGEFSGLTLHELIRRFGDKLLGRDVCHQISSDRLPERLRGRFPLLLKFLDAARTLSVQVHPDDQAGLLQTPPDLGKTEAWYVLDAAPGSLIYAGLKAGVDHDALRRAVELKTTDDVLHSFEAKRGDCVFVPAGTVHAIGEGLLIAEIQQSSDTTFRLFDWNRVDADGRPRDLHIESALAVADFDRGPVSVQVAGETGQEDPVDELVRCDKFVIRRWSLDNQKVSIETGDRFRLLMMTDGELQVDGDPMNAPLCKGQTMLVPAVTGSVGLAPTGRCEFLDITTPESA